MTTVETTTGQPATGDAQEALVGQLVAGATGAFELLSVWVGQRLGAYAALDAGPATPQELARRAGVDERYTREWLEHQAAAGIVSVDDPAADPEQRRYRLSPAHREVLLDETSPYYATPLAMALAGVAPVLTQLLQAYRTGAGVQYAEYGEEMRDHNASMNRPMYEHDLASSWIPAVPGLAERLSAAPPAQVLDVACGSGWSSVCLARAYPQVRVDGVDADGPSVERARRHATEAGVADRVTFHVADAAEPGPAGPYDAALIFDALHDLPHPVEALAAVRQRLSTGGVVLVGDLRAPEVFTAPGGDVDRLLYGFSLFHCLPAGRTRTPSAATGAVLRPDTLFDYAQQAGFSEVEVLDIDHDFWRFYRLAG